MSGRAGWGLSTLYFFLIFSVPPLPLRGKSSLPLEQVANGTSRGGGIPQDHGGYLWVSDFLQSVWNDHSDYLTLSFPQANTETRVGCWRFL